jgi:hypothetical protein
MRVSSPLFRKQLLSAQRFGAKKGRVWAIQLFPSVRQRARARIVCSLHRRNKKRVIKFALQHSDCENSGREREQSGPTGCKIKVNGKRSTINFQSLTGNGHESWRFCTHQTGKTKQGMRRVRVDGWMQYRPSNYHTSASRARAWQTHTYLSANGEQKQIYRATGRVRKHCAVPPCRFGTHKQIRIMPLS